MHTPAWHTWFLSGVDFSWEGVLLVSLPSDSSWCLNSVALGTPPFPCFLNVKYMKCHMYHFDPWPSLVALSPSLLRSHHHRPLPNSPDRRSLFVQRCASVPPQNWKTQNPAPAGRRPRRPSRPSRPSRQPVLVRRPLRVSVPSRVSLSRLCVSRSLPLSLGHPLVTVFSYHFFCRIGSNVLILISDFNI